MRCFDRRLSEDELDDAMRSIGMRLGWGAIRDTIADIELTLTSTVEQALPHDYRVLGVLVAWLTEHHSHVNVRRLRRIVKHRAPTPLACAFWAAVGRWLKHQDPRWEKLELLHTGAPLDLDDPDANAIQLQRVGPDPRFIDSALIVHAKLLRSRQSDVDSQLEVASRHAIYRTRLELGPNDRADVWYALACDAGLTASQLVDQVGCKAALARSVIQDFLLLQRARARPLGATKGVDDDNP